MKRGILTLGTAILVAVCLMVVLPSSSFAWGKKYVKFAEFAPKGQEQEAILAFIKDFRKTTNSEDKPGHFALFTDDAVLIVQAGQHYFEKMNGKQEIIDKTPWTGTKVQFTKIWFGKTKDGTARVNTKVTLTGGERGRSYATYEWILVQVKDTWKIKKLTMSIQ